MFFLLFMVGCTVYAQRTPKIKGNRNVIEVRETLPPFNAIELNDDLDIHLQATGTEEYIIEADDNLIDVLKFRVENETLIISSYYRITSKRKLDITINFAQLNQITAKAGNIVCKDRFSTSYLEVNTLGSGRVDLDVDAYDLSLNMQGNSKGYFKVDSDTLNLVLLDKSDLKLYGVMEKTILEMRLSAKADLEGFTNELAFNLSGSSELKASRLEANRLQAEMEGRTSAEILSMKTVDLISKGDAKTYVFGEGKINLLEFLDASELYRRKN